MTKNGIITELYNSKEFNRCINTMHPDYLRDELKAEVCLVICEQDEEFLCGLYQRYELNFWVTRVVLNMIQSRTSRFYKTFRQPLIEYVDNITDEHTGAE